MIYCDDDMDRRPPDSLRPLNCQGALVIPCPLLVAYAWSRGDIGDMELMQSPRVCEAVYWVELPRRAVFARAMRETLALWQRGASVVVLRTDAPAVVHHVEKWGAYATHTDPSGRRRYYASADVCRRYFGRIAQNSPAAAGVTISR